MFKQIVLLLVFTVSAVFGTIVQSITSQDNIDILDKESLVFVLTKDSEHPDTPLFEQAYTAVANDINKYDILPTKWFVVDAISDPALENKWHARAINTIEGTPVSRETGEPTGSYVSVHMHMFEQQSFLLDFKVDPD